MLGCTVNGRMIFSPLCIALGVRSGISAVWPANIIEFATVLPVLPARTSRTCV